MLPVYRHADRGPVPRPQSLVPPCSFCSVDREADVCQDGEIAAPFAQEQPWPLVQLNIWQEELLNTLRQDQKKSQETMERWRDEVSELLRSSVHSIQESVSSLHGALESGATMGQKRRFNNGSRQSTRPKLDAEGMGHLEITSASDQGGGNGTSSSHATDIVANTSASHIPRTPAGSSIDEPFLSLPLPAQLQRASSPAPPHGLPTVQGSTTSVELVPSATPQEAANITNSQSKKNFMSKFPIHKGTEANVEALKKAKGWSEDQIPDVGKGPKGSGHQLRSSMIWSCAFLESHLWMFSSFLVLSNTIFIGCQVDVAINRAQNRADEPEWMLWVSRAFAVLFTVELLLRLAVFKSRFFCGYDRWWNFFEIGLVLTTWAEMLFEMLDLSFIRALRVFRAVRTVRVVRIVRWVRELRLMVASILCSLMSLAWAFVFLFFVLYIFAIYILMDVQAYIDRKHAPDSFDSWNSCGTGNSTSASGTPAAAGPDCQLLVYYGSLWDAMISLFKAISGGQDWYELLDPLERVSPIFYTAFFVFYVGFVVFGIMNILTAIFVESASSIAEIDKDLVIQEQISRQNSAVNALRRVFYEADTNNSQTITREELEVHLQDEQVMAYLKFLELDIQETRGLFQLLDVDEKDEVGIEEIVMGMMRLKGAAKGVDIATLMYENKRIFVRLAAFMHFVEDNFQMIGNLLADDANSPGFPRTSMEEYVWSARLEDKMRRHFSNRVDMAPQGNMSQLMDQVRSQQLAPLLHHGSRMSIDGRPPQHPTPPHQPMVSPMSADDAILQERASFALPQNAYGSGGATGRGLPV